MINLGQKPQNKKIVFDNSDNEDDSNESNIHNKLDAVEEDDYFAKREKLNLKQKSLSDNESGKKWFQVVC